MRAHAWATNQREAIRAIRAEIDSETSLASLLAEDFCTSRVTCLMHRLDEPRGHMRHLREPWVSAARKKIRSIKSPYVIGIFEDSEEFARVLRVIASRRASRA